MFIKASLIIDDITALDLQGLKKQGIKGFIFDLDNTLIAPKTSFLEDRIREWLTKVHQEGFKTFVVSNNKKLDYVKKTEGILNIESIGYACKPSSKAFYQALEVMQLKAEDVAVVGDRPLTDILGGQRIGAYTILVDPLTKLTEPWYIQGLRALERSLIQK